MKGNKPLMYVLIAGVVLIWGIVFYRIFDSSTNNGPAIPTHKPQVALSSVALQQDSFQLLPPYRDPFLSGTPYTERRTSSGGVKPSVKKKEKELPPPPVQTDWSFINYLGLVINKDQNKAVGLVLINSKEYMVKEGDEIAEVKILKNTPDSVNVSYKKEKKWIRRK